MYSTRGISVLLFVLFYLYILLLVDTRLVYEELRPVFYFGSDFFKPFLDYPGGLVKYISALLETLYWYPWLGALIITTVTLLTCASARWLLKGVCGRDVHPWIYLIPALLVLVILGGYTRHTPASLGILAALIFANIYFRIPLSKFVWRLPVFLIHYAIVYYIAAGGCVLFALLCAIFELLKRRRIVLGVICLLCGPLLPYAVARYSFYIEPAESFALLLPPYRGSLPTIATLFQVPMIYHFLLAIFFPVAAIVVAFRAQFAFLWAKIVRRLARIFWPSDQEAPAAQASRPQRPAGWTIVSLPLFIVIAVLLGFVSFDGGHKQWLVIQKHVADRNWQQVLAASRRLPTYKYDIFVMHDVNRALFYTGKLPEAMLAHPIFYSSASLLLTAPEVARFDLAGSKSAEIFFELGHVNIAEHTFHTALEEFGARPTFLKHLARINILKGHDEAARTYLGMLRKNPVYRSWATQYLGWLEDGQVFEKDPFLQQVKDRMIGTDYAYVTDVLRYRFKDLLKQLLRSNKHNRMAFEYLMGISILQKNSDEIANNISRLSDFEYKRIPRHYEEAILVCRDQLKNRKIDLGGRHISQATQKRYFDFVRIMNRAMRNKMAARGVLAKRHGDSYFFYNMYGRSGSATLVSFPPIESLTGATK